jgi:beta-galactosidase/beta-glucuronidase
MRTILIASITLLVFVEQASFAQWKKIPGRISSSWSEKVDPSTPLPEYPRPQMERGNWTNLNGLWNYAVTGKNANASSWNGQILVPFAIESSLSGVGRMVGKDSSLWYNREFSLRKEMKGKKILLHFGAVDWRTKVFVNGKEAGTHEGGFDPFVFDITPLLKKSGEQELTLNVWDPTDEGPQPRGKQVVKPEGIWYTPVTGIWQTVWIEAVPDSYISSIKPTPDVDNQSVSINATAVNAKDGDKIMISAWDGTSKKMHRWKLKTQSCGRPNRLFCMI